MIPNNSVGYLLFRAFKFFLLLQILWLYIIHPSPVLPLSAFTTFYKIKDYTFNCSRSNSNVKKILFDSTFLCFREIETAKDCINATDVEGLCEDEKETPKWEEALQNQTSYYKSFCCKFHFLYEKKMQNLIRSLKKRILGKKIMRLK